MGLSSIRLFQIAGAMVLAFCTTASLAQPGERFNLFNKTQVVSQARTGRSVVWDRELPIDRHFSYYAVEPEERTREDRGSMKYQDLCLTQSQRKAHSEPGYEFLPPYYDEVTCFTGDDSYLLPRGPKQRKQQCSYPHDCKQRYRELFVGRHQIGSRESCWDIVPVIIPAGCDCMWPETVLGKDLAVN